jgi:cytochrome P450
MAGGVNIVWLPMLLHRDKSLWGEDADEFIPERWIDPESIARYVANPFMYGPFSYGPRTCLGRGYALNEASYFLVRLLQHFDTLVLAPECQPIESIPRPEWGNREGRQSKEKIWPAAAMTLYVKVSDTSSYEGLRLS